jgi:WD40 repeat protein
VASATGTEIRAWDIEELLAAAEEQHSEPTQRFDPNTDHLTSLVAGQVSCDLLIGATDSGKVIVWNWRTREIVWGARLLGSGIRALSVHQLGSDAVIIAGDRSGDVMCAALNSGALLAGPTHVGEDVFAIASHADGEGSWCAAACKQKDAFGRYEIVFLEVPSLHLVGNRLELFAYRDKTLYCVDFVCDGVTSQLLAAGPDGFVRTWRLDRSVPQIANDYMTPLVFHDLRGNESHINSYVLCLAAGDFGAGPVLAAGMDEKELVVWDLRTGSVLHEVANAHATGITSIAVGDEHRPFAYITGSRDGILRMWSANLKPVYEIDCETEVSGIALLPDDHLAIATTSGLLVLRSSANGR